MTEEAVEKSLEERIRERIAEMEKERDEFVQRANQSVAAYNGGIAELKRLLEPPKPGATDEQSGGAK